MKVLFRLMVLGLFISGTSFAQTQDFKYTLKDLDVLKTCKLGSIQEVNAELALSHLKSFIWWNLKDQYESFHPDMKHWHASLAGIIAANPASEAGLPFKKGVMTKENFVKSFAIIAYLNDITKYAVIPSRLDCLGDDTVIIVSEFKAPQVRRDANGCITHALTYGSPTKLQFEFRDHQEEGSDHTQRLVYRLFSHLDENASLKVKAELAVLAQGPNNVQPNPANCKTLGQIQKEFQEQIDN